MIPKIIWQTQEPEFKDLLPFQKRVIDTWINLNPGWEHRYIDAKQREQEVKEYNNTLYQAYILASGVNQADIWRIIVTYKYGGVYADMDSICTLSLDNVLKKHYNNEDMISTSIGFQVTSNCCVIDGVRNRDYVGVNCSNFATTKNSKTMKSILDEVIVECDTILNSGHNRVFKDHGIPVWLAFSKNAVKNEYGICYLDDYFIHSKDFKVGFEG